MKRMKNNCARCVYLCVSMLFSVCATALAQEKIATDRPDQSQGPSVVARGLVQVETGYLSQKRDRRTKTHAYPTGLLRIGVLQGVELRIQGALKDSVIENGNRRRMSGWGPISVGAKVRLWEGKSWRPEAAVSAMVALPVGSAVFRPDKPEPQLNLGLRNTLSDNLDLTYNLGYGWTGGEPVRSYGANLAREFGDRFTLYLEVFGSKGKGEPAEHQADLGLLFLLLPNVQFDVAIGRRVNNAAPHRFVATGLAFRLPR